jgi:hypothetical protein
LLTCRHIDSELTTHDRRRSLLDEDIWHHRIIAMKCHIILISRVREKYYKCRENSEEDIEKEFLHEKKNGK